MSLLVLDQATLLYGDRLIFSELNLRLAAGDRIGLIGPNGSGKTSLLKVIAGQQELDDGTLTRPKGVRIGWLPQDLVVEGGQTLLRFIVAGVPGRAEIEQRLARTEKQVETLAAGDDESALEKLTELSTEIAELHEQLEHFDRDYGEHQAYAILNGLGFAPGDEHRDLREFSGGWKMRAVLAALLFQRPDVLLLDEPTNHLDMPSVAWFGEFLQRYRGAFILISHDREFLNEQINRVVSFEPEGVRMYTGNHDSYRRQREEESVLLANRAKNIARERERLQRFIERFRAKATKAAAAQSKMRQLEKLESVDLHESRAVMRFSFEPTERTVQDVVRLQGVRKAFGERVIFPGLDLTVRRGEKIGIIGVNGAGKTTLLKMIAGELAPDAGTIQIGQGVRVGYYAQHHAETLDMSATVLGVAQRANPDATLSRVRAILGAFMFSGDDVDKPVRVLSGGERARLALARLLIKPGTLLLMDEPTNHLDLDSAESLGQSLQSFDGTLVFVSHSRSLIKSLATKIWNVENQTVENYPGTLDEYLFSLQERRRMGERATAGASLQRYAPGKAGVASGGTAGGQAAVATARTTTSDATPAATSRATGGTLVRNDKERRRLEAEQRTRRQQVLGPLQRKVTQLENEIDTLETELRRLQRELADPANYADAEKNVAYGKEYAANQKRLAECNEAWEEASLALADATQKFEQEQV